MAAFRSGIRWADMSTESFSRSKTAPGNTTNAALLLQAEQADQSYAPGEAVVLPEFENSQAGMNQYFLAAAALEGDDSSKHGAGPVDGTQPEAASCSLEKCASRKTGPKEDEGSSSNMPGFRGLLFGAPADGNAAGATAEDPVARRRERSTAAGSLEATPLTPAKRNRRVSGAPVTTTSAVQQTNEAPAQDGSASAAPEVASQRLPHSKRHKPAHGRRSFDGQCSEQSKSISAAISSNGQNSKRRGDKKSYRRKSGGSRRASEGPGTPGLLLPVGASSFLQLPGLVSPMFMPVGLAPGAAAPLPGLLHPQVVQQQQARVNSTKEQQEQEDEEEWQRRECARMKDIAIGKATAGYRNFLKQVGTERRSEGDPMTPDAKLRCSKAQFQRAYQKWRKQLHRYDTLDDECTSGKQATVEAQSPTEGILTGGNEPEELPQDSKDQKDLEVILAFNKECELAGL